MNERLDPLGARIERLALDPDRIESQGFFRVARPLFALTGWRARVRYEALGRLVDAMRATDGKEEGSRERAEKALAAAIDEIEANVSTVERAAIVRKRPPVAHAAWLRRQWELLRVASLALATPDNAEASGDDEAVRAVAQTEPSAIAPPLGLRAPPTKDGEEAVAEVPVGEPIPETEEDARLVELELAAIDRLLDTAHAERSLLGRKRRLLVAARQRLLEACAALPVDPAGARVRADAVARGIARIDRLEHAGLSPDVALVHQARLAVTRGDPRLAYTALAAIEGAAAAAGDARIAGLAGRGLRALAPGDPASPDAREASLQRSARELLGEDVLTDIGAAIEQAREVAAQRVVHPGAQAERLQAKYEAKHFCAGAELDLARAAVSVDGCFEVGGALAPVRIADEERVLRQVRHPTAKMLLVPARDVDDLAHAVVTDPRAILLDLAAGRLLSRHFVEEEVRPVTRVLMKSEVRVYVLDGSDSMIGRRGRVRDALLLAELATLVERLRRPRALRCTLFYRYFDTELGPVARVDGVAAARAAIRDVAGTLRRGGTDIQKALVASLEQVAEARALDPDLARAQIVLVTDGESPIDDAVIAAARASLGELPVGVSVIALGKENPALRALVAAERAKGEPAFYHFVDDEQLGAIVDGSLDAGLPVHLRAADVARATETLASEIGPLVDELGDIERKRDLAALERLDVEAQARREGGVDGSTDEGERARAEALNRDRTALLARYARWFPEPARAAGGDAMPPPDDPDREDVEAAVSVLASVAEVTALLAGTDLGRRADAIELIERLLPDAHLTPARYRALLRAWPGAVHASLRAVHGSMRAPG